MKDLNTEALGQGSQDDRLLLLEMGKMANTIISTMDALRLSEREAWDHSASNWASEIHHPCAKHLTHARVDWQEKQLPNVDSLYRFEEGHDQERKINEMFLRAGYMLEQAQRKYKWEEFLISGKIDGTLRPIKTIDIPESFGKVVLPTEIKTLNPHFWESTKTIEDLKAHPKFWINKIPSQLNVYLFMMGEPGGFLVLKTFGKKPRMLPMLIDYDLADLDTKKAETVNRHVKAGTYPEPIPYDPSVCGLCGFDHICQPLKSAGIREISEMDTIELEMYCELKEIKKNAEKDFKKEHDKLIGNQKKPGRFFGIDAFLNDIEIKTSTQNRKRKNDCPGDCKNIEPHELTTTAINRVGI